MAQRLANLRREIVRLRRCFLPDPFHPLGIYPNPDWVQMRTRAFLVLCHAEIETYIEEWAKDIAKAAETVWNTRKRVAAPLAFLIASLGERIQVIESLSPNPVCNDSRQRFADIVARVFPHYYKSIKDNHGVKEQNVLKLFDPLGVAAIAYPATLLPNLDSFGQLRGEHAHYARKAIKNVLDPETEFNRVDQILTDLTTLEQWLSAYRRAVR